MSKTTKKPYPEEMKMILRSYNMRKDQVAYLEEHWNASLIIRKALDEYINLHPITSENK